MTDRAKALADEVRSYLAPDDLSERGKRIRLEKALVAYDAHPAEYRISDTVGERNAMGAENHMQPAEAATRESAWLQ